MTTNDEQYRQQTKSKQKTWNTVGSAPSFVGCSTLSHAAVKEKRNELHASGVTETADFQYRRHFWEEGWGWGGGVKRGRFLLLYCSLA